MLLKEMTKDGKVPRFLCGEEYEDGTRIDWENAKVTYTVWARWTCLQPPAVPYTQKTGVSCGETHQGRYDIRAGDDGAFWIGGMSTYLLHPRGAGCRVFICDPESVDLDMSTIVAEVERTDDERRDRAAAKEALRRGLSGRVGGQFADQWAAHPTTLWHAVTIHSEAWRFVLEARDWESWWTPGGGFAQRAF